MTGVEGGVSLPAAGGASAAPPSEVIAPRGTVVFLFSDVDCITVRAAIDATARADELVARSGARLRNRTGRSFAAVLFPRSRQWEQFLYGFPFEVSPACSALPQSHSLCSRRRPRTVATRWAAAVIRARFHDFASSASIRVS
jgi:hypothetical protein